MVEESLLGRKLKTGFTRWMIKIYKNAYPRQKCLSILKNLVNPV